MNKKNSLIYAAFIFFLALGIGFWIANHKYLWTDEMYTLTSSIERTSWIKMLRGQIPEGGNAPLYYLTQKAFFKLIGYQVPQAWVDGNWSFEHRDSRIIVRILPVICMSLSIALVFYFFIRYYAWWAGIGAMVLYASSYMLWVYWAEARPYALIVLLTTLQLLFFIRFFQSTKKIATERFIIIGILLSFTHILSLSTTVPLVVLAVIFNKLDWKKGLGICAVVLMISIYYYLHAPKYLFHFDQTPEQLIRDNFPRERFYVLFLFLGMFCWPVVRKNLKAQLPLAGAAVAALLATMVIILIFWWRQSPVNQGFPVTNRYFIYLMPISVVCTLLFAIYMARATAFIRWLPWVIWLTVVGLCLPKFFKIVPRAIASVMGGA